MRLAEDIAQRLGEVPGVAAVALGGSWARGEARLDSDVDLGLYYHPDCPPDVEDLRRLARDLDDRRLPDLATGLGAWGPWINGGGWLRVEGGYDRHTCEIRPLDHFLLQTCRSSNADPFPNECQLSAVGSNAKPEISSERLLMRR